MATTSILKMISYFYLIEAKLDNNQHIENSHHFYILPLC